LALDLDGNYANGVSEFGNIADTAAGLVADATNPLTTLVVTNYVSTS
jgi:hypothetical protein